MRTAIYLRISSEDADLRTSEKDESESISNQRSLLREYVSSRADLSDSEILEFCDDGWSGTNFERPAVKELLEQVRRGQINCILVKDLSRFGRDYLTVGDYISRVFPFLGVRFISVNDGFDSSNPLDIDSLDTSFRTLIYDLYSRDLSRRVKSAKKARAERGAFLSPYAPYGYVKDPEDKNHLLVDTEAADVIRRIFQMAADGAKPWQIAAALNGDGVSSPKNYKAETGCTRTPWRSIQEENFWTASLVAKFLRDERYIGKTVFGKRSRDVVGSTHTVKIARNDWIVVPNRHEAIVPEALFQKAQAVMREYREYEVSSDSGNPLKRKVICGVCGHAMQRDGKKNGSYRCVTKRLNTSFDCSEDRIPEADILEAVIDTIQVYAQYAVSIDRLLQTRQAQRDYPLKGLVRCGNCKRAMTRRKNKAGIRYFQCIHSVNNGNTDCPIGRSFPEMDIEKVVFHALTQFLALAQKEAVQNREVGDLRKSAIKECADKIRILQKQNEQHKASKLRLYEKYAAGSITKEAYIQQKTATDTKIAENDEAIQRSHERMKELDSETSYSDEKLDAVCDQYADCKALTYELTHAFISAVYIYDLDNIEIVWKFKDFLNTSEGEAK